MVLYCIVLYTLEVYCTTSMSVPFGVQHNEKCGQIGMDIRDKYSNTGALVVAYARPEDEGVWKAGRGGRRRMHNLFLG
jgi:hypothetical protein